MKKLLLFSFLQIATIMSLMAQTGSFTYSRPDGSSFNCVVTSDSTAKLTGGNVDSLNRLILPDTVYQGTTPYLLIDVDSAAFESCRADYVCISNSIRTIGPNAFKLLLVQDSLTIGSGVESIGDWCFYRLSLRKIRFNARNCTNIGEHCFTGRGGTITLRELIIGDSVQSIPNGLMSHWTRTAGARIIIGPNVTSIGDNNFHFLVTSQRAEIVMLGLPPTVSQNALNEAIGCSIAIQVPCEYMSQYQSDSIWGNCNLVPYLHRIRLKASRGTAEVTTPLSCTNNVATIVATPDAGYRFVGWSDGDTSATRNIIVDRDTIIAARFEPILDSGDYAFFFDFDNPANDSLWVLPDSLDANWHIGDNYLVNNINGSRCLYVSGVQQPDGTAPMGTGSSDLCANGCGSSGVVYAYYTESIYLPERTYIPHIDCNLCQTYICHPYGIGISTCPTVALVPDSAALPTSSNDHGSTCNMPEGSIILENDNQMMIPEGAYKLAICYSWSGLWDTIGASVDNIWLEIIDSVNIILQSKYIDRYGRSNMGTTLPTIRAGYNDTFFFTPPPIRDSDYYHFSRWGGNYWPDGEYSTDSLLQIVAKKDLLLNAHYDPNIYNVSIDTTGLSPCMTIGEGSYPYASMATIGITVDRGNSFTGWTNGATNNPHTFQVLGDTILYPIILPAQRDTVWVDIYIHDTTYLWQYDTTIVIQYDTTYITQYIHDTVTESIVYYNLSVTSGNPACGIAAGSGRFPEGTIVEIAAIPFSGNRFLHWDDGNSDNPRMVTLDGNQLFTALFDTEGISSVEASRWWLRSERGALIVEGAAGRTIKIYNMWGQLLTTYPDALNRVRFEVPAAGSYVVRIDDGPAKKATVIR